VQGCPLNNLALELSFADPEFRSALHAIFGQWRRQLAERLREDQAAGRAGPADAEAVATLVVAAYSGAMALSKAEQNSSALRMTAGQLASLLP
jgi:hypothetical protein